MDRRSYDNDQDVKVACRKCILEQCDEHSPQQQQPQQQQQQQQQQHQQRRISMPATDAASTWGTTPYDERIRTSVSRRASFPPVPAYAAAAQRVASAPVPTHPPQQFQQYQQYHQQQQQQQQNYQQNQQQQPFFHYPGAFAPYNNNQASVVELAAAAAAAAGEGDNSDGNSKKGFTNKKSIPQNIRFRLGAVAPPEESEERKQRGSNKRPRVGGGVEASAAGASGSTARSAGESNKKSNKSNEEGSNWSKEDHRRIVEAIYELGLKHASPAVILEHMTEASDDVTGERLKSHLQKYRKNKDKSREEFLLEYDAWMEKALALGCVGGTSRYLVPPKAIAEIVGTKKLIGGDLPAFLSYSLMQEESVKSLPYPHHIRHQGGAAAALAKSFLFPTSIDVRRKHFPGSLSQPHQVLSFPILTEEERSSPLGACLSHVLGLFYPMAHYMLSERATTMNNDRQTATTTAEAKSTSSSESPQEQGEEDEEQDQQGITEL